MVGAFAAGFVLIPLLGLQKGMIAIALVNAGLALAAVWVSGLQARPRLFAVAAMCMVAGTAVFITPKNIFFRRHDENWSKLIFYREDNTATVKVYDMPGEKRVISINGYEVAGARVSLHEIQKALGHYPVLLQKNPQTALVIGFGAGGTCAAISQHRLTRIDLVEIVPAVLEAAPYLVEVNNGVLKNPIVHPVIDDGRNFVHSIQRTYDIISVDSIDPKHAGNGNLYTVEFYRDCLSKLNPGGIMVQWIPYHLLTEQELKIILNSFSEVFPHHNLWFTPLFNYFILAGSPGEIVADYAAISEQFADPGVRKDLALINIKSASAFISTFAMDESRIEAYIGKDRMLNSFDHPRIEFFGKYRYSTFGQLFIDSPCDNIRLVNLGKNPQEEKLALEDIANQRLIARNMVKGAYYFTRKAYGEAMQHWLAALRLDPRNAGAKYMLKAATRHVNNEMNKHIALMNEYPDDPMPYFRMAVLLESINKWNQAVPMYLKAITLKPDLEQAYTNLGLIYIRAGNYEKALEVFQTALYVNPVSLAAAQNTGMLLYLKGDFVQAKLVCRQALARPAGQQDKQLRAKIQEILRLAELAYSQLEAKPS
jgi:spermidine synthase